jgi:hypothetical protein
MSDFEFSRARIEADESALGGAVEKLRTALHELGLDNAVPPAA